MAADEKLELPLDLNTKRDEENSDVMLNWYEAENTIFEGNLDSSEDENQDWSNLEQQLQNLYDNAENYTTQSDPNFNLSPYHKSNHVVVEDKEEEARDLSDGNTTTTTTTTSQENPYTEDFYSQAEHIQVAIYAQDIVTLQDQNFHLKRQLEKEREAHKKYKKEAEQRNFEIERLSKERDRAWEEKFELKKRGTHLEQILKNLKEELESERNTREAVPSTPREVLEHRVCQVKYELAKYKEQCDDLNFRLAGVLSENQNLKEASQIQQKQLHDFGSLLSRSGIQLSSLQMNHTSRI